MERHGFSTLELIIALGIFAAATASVLPFLGRFQQEQTIDSVTRDVVQMLQVARHHTLSGERGSPWGVRFQTGAYTLYTGSSYANRNTTFDRSTTVVNISFSGLPEVTFRKLTGASFTGGTVMIMRPSIASRKVQVNAAGGIFPQ